MVETIYPNQRGWNIINAGIALTVLTIIAVVLRFYARWYKKISFGGDDWFALGGLVCIFAMFIQLVLWVVAGGQGYHIGEVAMVDPNIITAFFKIFLANQFTYAVTSPVIKISILLFYRRIFQTKGFRLASNIMIGLVTAWGVSVFVASGLQCRPLAKSWDPTVPGVCFETFEYILAIQGINIVLDFAILIFPVKPIWGLHRPWQDKVALIGVFLIGGFVCFASIYRIAVLLQLDVQDMTYSTYEGAIWTFVEPCIGLVCGCLPVIRGLLPAYHSKQRTGGYMGSKGRGGTPLFSFGNSMGGAGLRSKRHAPPQEMTDEEYLRVPSAEGYRSESQAFAMEDPTKIRVHTSIHVR